MLDFEYAKALAEVVLDTTCSEKEREVGWSVQPKYLAEQMLI